MSIVDLPLPPQALLGHPLCLTLLHFKWHRLARYLYYVNLLLYITFLTFLTGYIISTPPPNAYSDKLAALVTVHWAESPQNPERCHQYMSQMTFFRVVHSILFSLLSVRCQSATLFTVYFPGPRLPPLTTPPREPP